ncbi:phosphatidylserine decarboxylase family protein [Saprospiraceae bacterium]|jgi:phosphatidylserine decarboxylase|nr:phosphatidylserine decarboxylase family protein [Saprospiraceae bacterium]MDC3209934.1 phosphatidylserine decarboxylase family protein [Saprospiraceae bacterium]MDG1435287.1 phosphatidylserine decarboxylase family protein [Saprospiraceae bacterium]
MRLKIHKEGYKILTGLGLFFAVVNLLVFWYLPNSLQLVGIISMVLFLLVLQFFRNPSREIILTDDNVVYAPADGKIVTIEEVVENEYFKTKKLQVSIFMSPVNVHVNRNPVSGTVNYYKYHPGKYLVAWHPKSSTENERTTTVINNNGEEILLRQIAGFLAKRIVNYVEVGQEVEQGKDMGFIKFGSRVDLYLPLDTKIEVEIGQKVKGNKTILARL